jgi:hypothetical protein
MEILPYQNENKLEKGKEIIRLVQLSIQYEWTQGYLNMHADRGKLY